MNSRMKSLPNKVLQKFLIITPILFSLDLSTSVLVLIIFQLTLQFLNM